MPKKKSNKTVRVVRWIARVSSGIVATLILLTFAGGEFTQGVEPFFHLSFRETLIVIAFVTACLGLLLGWKWEIFGGLLTVCGVAAFYLLNYLFLGTLPQGPFFLIFALPGFLFLYCGLQTRMKTGA